jgi:hypothetical protein
VSDQPEAEPVTWEGAAERAYANSVAINGGPFDITLIFGLQQQPSPSQPVAQPPVQEVVRVAMSWGHAKSMIPLLARMVAEYETKFGPIPSPGFDENWRA